MIWVWSKMGKIRGRTIALKGDYAPYLIDIASLKFDGAVVSRNNALIL